MPGKIPFRVVHVSGQDENFKAVELNAHSPTTKGWQSSRFCLYPQDIVIQLDKRSRLRKIQILSHQFLIATKIEFYVGDVPEQTPLSLQNARYTRLGYVALSDNGKTGFKARELKSVHVDAVGFFVKFVIHKNHINKHNLYNQVGVVALNVIGDDLAPSSDLTSLMDADSRVAQDPSLAGLFNRPDYISPLDDLAFDMYQDPEVAQIIRKLEKKKQEAVLQERYDFAKKLKSSIQELQKVGERLGKYEVEKRQAVESEDYDKAKIKKVQSDEYRLQMYRQLQVSELLEVSGSRHDRAIDLEPTQPSPPPRLTELPSTTPTPRPGSPPKTPYDDRPLPAIKNTQSSPSPTPLASESMFQAAKPNKDDETPTPSTDPDDRPLRSETNEPDNAGPDDSSAEPPGDNKGNVTGEPEKMSEKDQRGEGSLAIEVFGLPLASKAFSKTWSFREDALLEIYKIMEEMPASTPKDESRTTLRAAVSLITRALKDKVFAVFTAATNVLKLTLTEFVVTHKISKGDTATAAEKTLPHLLQKTGDTAVRMRDLAKAFIIEESKYPEVKPLNVVTTECVKPFKLSTAPRLAQSRTEIVDILYTEHGFTAQGLTLENTMGFCTQALQHNAGEVRERAEKIIIQLYKDHGAPVKNFLPPDNDKTRKSVMYKKLFEAFDRIDGKPSKADLKRKKLEEEQNKQKEIDALQAQLQALRDMQKGKRPIDAEVIKEEPSPKKPQKGDKKKKEKEKEKEDDAASVAQIDHMCIFCGEQNESFTDEGLDFHYWRNCPMLKRCSFCKQVVEIASLNSHLLTECEQKDSYKQCKTCLEAIPQDEYEQHVKDKTCQNVTDGSRNACPLCHLAFPGGEDSWKKHLMGPNGCKQNPRRDTKKGGAPASSNKKSNQPAKKDTPGRGTPSKGGAKGRSQTKGSNQGKGR